MNFTLFFSIFAVVMTTMLGGLLIWLHFRLSQFKQAAKDMPIMAEKFTQTLMGARTEMQTLEKFATDQLPSMDSKITAARQAIDEIDYMLTKTKNTMDDAESLVTALKMATPDTATIETSATLATTPDMEMPPAQPVSMRAYANSASLSPQTPEAKAPEPAPQPAHIPDHRGGVARKATDNNGLPTFAKESISKAEMATRNKQSSAEQSLRESLKEILK